MKNILALILTAFTICADAANVRLYFQLPFSQLLNTNKIVATPISTNILASGGVVPVGPPILITPDTNGIATNYFNVGFYSVGPQAAYGQPASKVVINVYDSGPSLYDYTNILHSGFNLYVTDVYGSNSGHGGTVVDAITNNWAGGPLALDSNNLNTNIYGGKIVAIGGNLLVGTNINFNGNINSYGNVNLDGLTATGGGIADVNQHWYPCYNSYYKYYYTNSVFVNDNIHYVTNNSTWAYDNDRLFISGAYTLVRSNASLPTGTWNVGAGYGPSPIFSAPAFMGTLFSSNVIGGIFSSNIVGDMNVKYATNSGGAVYVTSGGTNVSFTFPNLWGDINHTNTRVWMDNNGLNFIQGSPNGNAIISGNGIRISGVFYGDGSGISNMSDSASSLSNLWVATNIVLQSQISRKLDTNGYFVGTLNYSRITNQPVIPSTPGEVGAQPTNNTLTLWSVTTPSQVFAATNTLASTNYVAQYGATMGQVITNDINNVSNVLQSQIVVSSAAGIPTMNGKGTNTTLYFGNGIMWGTNNSSLSGSSGNYILGAGNTIGIGDYNNLCLGNSNLIGNYAGGSTMAGIGIRYAGTGSSFGTMIGGDWQTLAASSQYSTIIGGISNTVSGVGSFAIGQRATAGSGTFVWNDGSSNIVFSSTAPNQYLIHSAGGVGINTNNPGPFALRVNGGVDSSALYINGVPLASAGSSPGGIQTLNGNGTNTTLTFSSAAWGTNNTIYGNGFNGSAILSGNQNFINGGSSVISSVIAGGAVNNIQGYGYCNSILGGNNNIIGFNSLYNTIIGGFSNTIAGIREDIGDGSYRGVVLAGQYTICSNSGVFIWGDNSSTNLFSNTSSNQFLIRSAGGVGINHNNPGTNSLKVNGNIDATSITVSGVSLRQPTITSLTVGSLPSIASWTNSLACNAAGSIESQGTYYKSGGGYTNTATTCIVTNVAGVWYLFNGSTNLYTLGSAPVNSSAAIVSGSAPAANVQFGFASYQNGMVVIGNPLNTNIQNTAGSGIANSLSNANVQVNLDGTIRYYPTIYYTTPTYGVSIETNSNLAGNGYQVLVKSDNDSVQALGNTDDGYGLTMRDSDNNKSININTLGTGRFGVGDDATTIGGGSLGNGNGMWAINSDGSAYFGNIPNVAISSVGDVNVIGKFSQGATIVTGVGGHSEGLYDSDSGTGVASGNYSHVEGFSSAAGLYSHSEGNQTYTGGNYAHSEGDQSAANGVGAHAEGNSTADGDYSHSENNSRALGLSSHSEGQAIASGAYSHAEGQSGNTASGVYSHVEGVGNTVGGMASYGGGINCGSLELATNSFVRGLSSTSAASNSFALGTSAYVSNANSFIWSDNSSAARFYSSKTNEFSVRALGGIRLLGGPITGDGSGLTNIQGLTGGNITNIADIQTTKSGRLSVGNAYAGGVRTFAGGGLTGIVSNSVGGSFVWNSGSYSNANPVGSFYANGLLVSSTGVATISSSLSVATTINGITPSTILTQATSFSFSSNLANTAYTNNSGKVVFVSKTFYTTNASTGTVEIDLRVSPTNAPLSVLTNTSTMSIDEIAMNVLSGPNTFLHKGNVSGYIPSGASYAWGATITGTGCGYTAVDNDSTNTIVTMP